MKRRFNLNPVVYDLVIFIVGLLAFAAGAYLIYPPAALIGAGVILMAISLFGGQAQ